MDENQELIASFGGAVNADINRMNQMAESTSLITEPIREQDIMGVAPSQQTQKMIERGGSIPAQPVPIPDDLKDIDFTPPQPQYQPPPQRQYQQAHPQPQFQQDYFKPDLQPVILEKLLKIETALDKLLSQGDNIIDVKSTKKASSKP